MPLVKLGEATSDLGRRVVALSGNGRGVAAGCGLVVGFLIALLIFGAPWHLPPNWGDIPTWLAAFFAAIAGTVAVRQLGILRRQISEEVARNEMRDNLMDRQLAEAERRFAAERRGQAEGVEVTWVKRQGAIQGVVINNSRRPINQISCRVMSGFDRALLKMPDESGELLFFQDEELKWHMHEPKPVWELGVLRPGSACGFVFKELQQEPEQVFVAWFKDDVGVRWQLDEYLHLVEVGDGDEVEYRQ